MLRRFNVLALLGLFFVHNGYAMDIVPYEKKLTVLCSQKFESYALQFFSKSIDSIIKEQHEKNMPDRGCVEAVLRLGKQLPIELQSKVLGYVFEREVSSDFLKKHSIASVLHTYADHQDFFKIYHNHPVIIDYGTCIKRGPWHKSMQLDCEQMRSLSVDEMSLLIKIIEGNTKAFSVKRAKKITPSVKRVRQITPLSDEESKKYGTLCKLKESDLSVMQSFLKKQGDTRIVVKLSEHDEYDISSQKEVKPVVDVLKFDIEYDGPTIRDRILRITPVALNCILPDIILHGVCFGTNFLVPHEGWLKIGVKTGVGFLGLVGTVKGGFFIGDRVFPFLDKYNSARDHLKKFVKNNVRSKFMHGDTFFTTNMGAFFCVAVGNYCLSYNSLWLRSVGYLSHFLRLFFNYLTYCDLRYDNPIDRRAPHANANVAWGVPYVLRHMEKQKQ